MHRTIEVSSNVGLLVLRLAAGGMLAGGHGLSKLLTFSEKAATFSDPLHVGSTLSLTLAIVGELFCPLFVVLGLATRAMAFFPLFTMLVAAVVVHADDPWGRKEFALLYAVPFLVLMFTGPGAFSLDGLFWKWRRARRTGAA